MEKLEDLYQHYNSQIHQEDLLSGVKYARTSVTLIEYHQECETDVVHTQLLHSRPKQFHLVDNEERESVASVALTSLLRYGLCNFLSNNTLLVLSRVCKSSWNLVSPHLYSKFYWKPAFPSREDVPRSSKTAFESYYVPISSSGKIHRITLTRKHITDPSIFACFVDGELIYLTEKQHDQTFHKILFNSPNWNFLPDQQNSPFSTIMFVVRGTKVLVDHNNFGDLYRAYNPSFFHVFINDVCTATGKSMKHHHEKALFRAYFILLILILLAPCVLLWLVIANFVIQPLIRHSASKACVVHKYWLPPGSLRHVRINELQLTRDAVGGTMMMMGGGAEIV